MQKRRPGKDGADLLAGNRHRSNKIALPRPLMDEVATYRALHLIQSLGVRPELATMLAGLAFGGGA